MGIEYYLLITEQYTKFVQRLRENCQVVYHWDTSFSGTHLFYTIFQTDMHSLEVSNNLYHTVLVHFTATMGRCDREEILLHCTKKSTSRSDEYNFRNRIVTEGLNLTRTRRCHSANWCWSRVIHYVGLQIRCYITGTFRPLCFSGLEVFGYLYIAVLNAGEFFNLAIRRDKNK